MSEAQQWREISFTYVVPEGWTDEQVDAAEERIIEYAAERIGCDCDGTSEFCKADWMASAHPLTDSEAAS